MWKKILLGSSTFLLLRLLLSVILLLTITTRAYGAEEKKSAGGSDKKEKIEATISVNERANLVVSSCRQCHALEATEEQKTNPDAGPTLFGIVGRPIAQAGGYNYSEDLKTLGTLEPTWTEDLLMAYLYNPKVMLRTRLNNKKARGKMGFKLNRIIDRQAILKLLKTLQRPEE